jgi:hypothetical protein
MRPLHPSDSRQLTARIPKRLYQEVKVTCAATGETVQAWMRDAFTTHLRRCQRRAMSESTRDESA